jgi:hypothetical protein
MASEGRQLPRRRRAIRFPLLALVAALLAAAALAAPAGADVVYDNPAAAAEPRALGFAASGTAELGTLVRFAGSARLDPQVRVATVVEACDEAPLDSACAIPGATFPLPATLSIYAANPDGSPSQLLARQTQTFALAYEGVQPLAFAFPGVTLPAEAIVSLAFDTATSGYGPTGLAGPADAVGILLVGPPAAGANPREAEGVYRAVAAAAETAPVFGFESAPTAWEGRQPAFTVEAATAPAPAAAAATAPAKAAPPVATPIRREYAIPRGKRMSVRFVRASARIAGPGALVQVKCTGASAARCIGTLSLSAAGAVHKAPYSIGKGRRQYVVVPLGSDLEHLDQLEVARATATASTVQAGGAAVKTKRALKLK